MADIQPSTYCEKHATYYAKHKDSIASKEKEAKRWMTYYERNKEAVKRRNLERYHKKRENYFTSPEYLAEQERVKELNTIVARLTELIPEVMKVPRRRRSTEKTPVTAAVAPVAAVASDDILTVV